MDRDLFSDNAGYLFGGDDEGIPIMQVYKKIEGWFPDQEGVVVIDHEATRVFVDTSAPHEVREHFVDQAISKLQRLRVETFGFSPHPDYLLA